MPALKELDLLVEPLKDKESKSKSGAVLSGVGITLLILYCVYTFLVYSTSYSETEAFWPMDEDRDFTDGLIECSSECLVLITSNRLGKRQAPYDPKISGAKIFVVTPDEPWAGSLSFWQDIYVLPTKYKCEDETLDEPGRWYCTAVTPISRVSITNIGSVDGSSKYDVTEEVYKRGTDEQLTGFSFSNPKDGTASGITEQKVGELIKTLNWVYGDYAISGFPPPPLQPAPAKRSPADARKLRLAKRQDPGTDTTMGASDGTTESYDYDYTYENYDWNALLDWFDSLKIYAKPDEFRFVTFSDSIIRHTKKYNTLTEAISYTAGIGGGMYGTIMLAMAVVKKVLRFRTPGKECTPVQKIIREGNDEGDSRVRRSAALGKDIP